MTQFTFDESIVSDLHKDARGWRPREYFWETWEAASDEEKQVIWDGLCNEHAAEIEREKRQQERAVAEFEEQIARNLSYGAADRQQAIRWVVESLDPSEMDMRYGGSWVCWEMGLPYSMEKEFETACREVLETMEENSHKVYPSY